MRHLNSFLFRGISFAILLRFSWNSAEAWNFMVDSLMTFHFPICVWMVYCRGLRLGGWVRQVGEYAVWRNMSLKSTWCPWCLNYFSFCRNVQSSIGASSCQMRHSLTEKGFTVAKMWLPRHARGSKRWKISMVDGDDDIQHFDEIN